MFFFFAFLFNVNKEKKSMSREIFVWKKQLSHNIVYLAKDIPYPKVRSL